MLVLPRKQQQLRAKDCKAVQPPATLTPTSAVSFTLGAPSLMRDLHCTAFDAILGLSLYLLGFGLLPLITSALSEEFGRQPLYYVSIIGFLLTHPMAALSQDIRPVLVARFLQGAFGSTGVVTVAGTIADIWSPHERGKPMSFYSLIAFAGNAVGGMAGGWIEVNSKLGWRWIQWIHVIAAGVYFLFFVSAVKETRISVILRKEAKTRGHTSEESGSLAQSDVQKSLREMLYLSCTRPIVLLLTEPIVFAISLWIGFAWGVYYCMIGSIPGVFRTLHRFNQGQVGSVYLIMGVGSVIGFFTNMYQEKLYQ
ncbi:hypothetical protein NLJ89_g8135 [Agrocybe chaxingu]|uniref:Major facilitator superfamily (MFS) profile domain-containing protein n=1 Tax=Agrocybe chaxingu TaxID=84603 RepID=A0A9W8JT75_9AGAR|nr:hypothetical protein NLJ89_g8135 [Agrocybe chaxingu]